MKLHSFLAFIILSVALSSCADNLSDLAANIQPTSDLIKLGANTYLTTSSNVNPVSINSRLNTSVDSLLLGNYVSTNGHDSIYGQTTADIIGQVACDLNFKFPLKTATQSAGVADSAQLVFICQSYAGDMRSPLRVKIFALNKNTLTYSQSYTTDINPLDYCDTTSISSLLGAKTFTKANLPKLYTKVGTDSAYTKINLSPQFVSKFTSVLSKSYATQTDFNAAFKGLYITTDYGSSTILNIKGLFLNYYYHYKYKGASDTGDSTVVNSVLRLPLNNTDGRIVNHFTHPNIAQTITTQNKQESLNFISTPAGVYTKIGIPLGTIKHEMDSALKNKKQVLNTALLDLEINTDTAFYNCPYRYILLIKESEKNEFFKTTYHSSVISGALAKFAYSQIGSTGKYRNYYEFDLASVINRELKSGNESVLNLIAVPVIVTFDSYNRPILIQEEYKVGGISLRSPKNMSSPMRFKLFYSGY
jgi:Domain of unknown function (DUF4270)